MPSPSPERGRSRSRQQTSANAKSHSASRTRSPPRRTISPRSRTPSVRDEKTNGLRNGRDRSRSPAMSHSRSRSPGRGGRGYRERSYTRSRSRGSPVLKSSKVKILFQSLAEILANGTQIVVEKLTKNVNESHLREIFGAYGPIRDLDLPINRQCKSASCHVHPGTDRTSHDQPRHRLHSLRRHPGRRSCNRPHARSATRRRPHQRIHRPPPPQILPLSTSSPQRGTTV